MTQFSYYANKADSRVLR